MYQMLSKKLSNIPLLKKFFQQKTVATLKIIDAGSLYFSKIAIHTGEGVAAKAHLKLWIPLLKRLGYDFCVITRTQTAFTQCSNIFKDINIVYAKTPQDIESVLNNLNIRIIFYLSNTGNNLHICRFTEYRHIFLGHGDSNKSASAHNAFKMYDEVWVSGQAHIDRFMHAGVNMSGSELRIIGQPQLVHIKERKTTAKKSFLYLPTWEGTYKEQSYSSLPLADILFTKENLHTNSIAIKSHPMTGTKDKRYSTYLKKLISSLQENNIKAQIYPSNIDVANIIPEHSGYICDNSAVITTALFFDKPLFVYTPHGLNYAETNIPYNNFSYTFTSPEEFTKAMELFCKEGDVLAEKRKQAIDYFISQEAMQSNAFKNFIDQLIYN